MNIDAKDLQKRSIFLKELEAQVSKMNSVTSKLNEIQDNVDVLMKLVNEMEVDSSLSDARKKLKTLNDSASNLEKLVFGIEDVKGYFDQPDTWQYKYRELYYGSYSNYGEPLQNEQIMLKEIEILTSNITNKINNFIANDWVEFENYLETNPIVLTKKIDTVNND